MGSDRLGNGKMILSGTIFRFYHGNSMQGTFSPGDYLLIEPVPLANIRSGDVIVYLGTDGEGNTEELTHRVVALIVDGIITKGDNNKHHDSAPVQEHQIIGRVYAVRSKNRNYEVLGGGWGLRYSKLRCEIFKFDRFIRHLFRRPYHMLRDSQIISKIWHPKILRLRILTDKGFLIKCLYGRRTVAQEWVHEKRFDVIKPFDLIIPFSEKSKFSNTDFVVSTSLDRPKPDRR